ncbi:putative dienelactone hydrolase [Sagittula marina]|uniref:Putative dienelactone hydrolase n=1 Tax=Sagittula marina TaxID=943940 RepID=A0A7W6GR09_9RHOB|nr:dienelactone hydrolase [Sagittula marina]MBB3984410.1 putative dienelactone hydrolase [Sagittula marina]
MKNMMKSATIAGVIVVTSCVQAIAADNMAGVQKITVASEERGADLEVTIWYPASTGGESVSLGENIFFEGTPALQGASVRDGTFPLVLLSHGAGLAGRAEAMSWIAAPLAQDGFIVAAPTHPGNTGRDRSAAETMKLWLRSSDISATLDAIKEDPTLHPHLANDQIGVLGLSMGGNTALSLVGARLDPELFASYCDTDELNASLCDWMNQSGVDLHKMDKRAAGRNNADPRIRFAMAIDPAPADIFALASLDEVSVPVSIVNLGKLAEIPQTIQASEIAAAISASNYQVIEDASHASMFPECKANAAEIALEEGIEDPICTDGNGVSRDAIHAQLIEMTIAAFRKAMPSES